MFLNNCAADICWICCISHVVALKLLLQFLLAIALISLVLISQKSQNISDCSEREVQYLCPCKGNLILETVK